MRSTLKKLRDDVVRVSSTLLGSFFSVAKRPIRSHTIALVTRRLSSPPRMSVVIQGPLKHENSFTLETIKIYQKTLLPTTQIIVSTWEDENEETLREIKKLGVHIVQSKKPENPGILNINYQLVSVKTALALARTLNSEFVLKTRTDTRLYAPNVESFLCGLLHSFPATSSFTQKYRILGLSLNTYLYRMYTISDLIVFGHIDDMTRYWDIPLDHRTKELPNSNNTLREWSKMRMVETYLTSTYLENIGRKLTWTLADSFQSLAENFVIIDEQSLDLFWYKYEYWNEYRTRDYTTPKNDVFLTFRDWITLYTDNKKISDVPEHVLDLPFKSKIHHD